MTTLEDGVRSAHARVGADSLTRSTDDGALRLINHAVYEPDCSPDEVAAGCETRVHDSALIGAPYRLLQNGDGAYVRLRRPTRIGVGCDIGPFCVVGEEAEIGDGTILDAYSHIEGGATIGRNVVVTQRATVQAKAVIDDDCVIAGLVCERAIVGAGSRVFGDLLHRQLDPSSPWDADDSMEPSPVLGARVFVGHGAKVIGGVEVGEGSYVCAGALVTNDVPPRMIVAGRNQHIEPADWRGSLGRSPFFEVRA